ncbi:F-box/kelch-repeat protein At3g23880 [Eucalyptus grandis]|uniref:F-box/kelch-repeat protein At3g23880 n=1 Tax=Eucalyptus grandis TaxID=71139 RepID=UPI00192F00D9|nr:F-box/kelch-repeat protein At3g23880 [Eucalyptus grandis]
MAGLPDEIKTEILLRLPAKSLVRFRCVCKSWNSMLTSTSFVEAYDDRSSRFGDKYLLKYNTKDSSRIGIHDLSSRLLSNLDPLFNLSHDTYELVGSSNGIVCLAAYDKYGHTRSRDISVEPIDPRAETPSSILLYRVGADRFRVEVYSLRRNSWKRIGSVFPRGFDPDCLGNQVVFRNFVCWSYQHDASLVLFDLVEEVFHRMVLPLSMRAVTECVPLLDGCLSLIARNPSRRSREVWIMKEFGAVEPWTKLYTIDLSSTSCTISQCTPLGFAGSRGIFFVKNYSAGLHVVSYNVETARFEKVQVQVDSVQSCRLVTYTQSLFSLMNTRTTNF